MENYETHTASMFLDGNYTGEATYRAVLDLAQEQTDAYELAQVLREFVEEEVLGNDPGSSLATDWLGACLGEVDWQELAEEKLTEIKDYR